MYNGSLRDMRTSEAGPKETAEPHSFIELLTVRAVEK
jgi:hypothetical protein